MDVERSPRFDFTSNTRRRSYEIKASKIVLTVEGIRRSDVDFSTVFKLGFSLFSSTTRIRLIEFELMLNACRIGYLVP
jgi:hypothetical protein